MYKASTLAAGLGLVLALAAASLPAAEKYVGVLGDALVTPDNDHDPVQKDGYGLDLRFGAKPDSGLPIEFRIFYGQLRHEAQALENGNRSGFGGNFLVGPWTFFGVTPYLLGGAGLVYSDSLPEHDSVAPYLDGGAGLYTAPLFGWPIRLRAEGRYSTEDFDERYEDIRVQAGVEWIWWRSEPPLPPPAEEPLRVVEAVEPPPAEPPARAALHGTLDSDGDGVFDDSDRCPDSPRRTPVDAEGCTVVKVLTLKGVNFELGSDRLRAESTSVLDEAALTLNSEFKQARVEVAGHTDSQGADAYNQKLSERRAQAVRKYLINRGVSGDRLTARGYGETEPVADNATAAGRAQNRRVELRVKATSDDRLPLNPRRQEIP